MPDRRQSWSHRSRGTELTSVRAVQVSGWTLFETRMARHARSARTWTSAESGRSFGAAGQMADEQVDETCNSVALRFEGPDRIHRRRRQSGMTGDVAAVLRGMIRRMVARTRCRLAFTAGGLIGRDRMACRLVLHRLLIVRVMCRWRRGRSFRAALVAAPMGKRRARRKDEAESHQHEQQGSLQDAQGIGRSHRGENGSGVGGCQSGQWFVGHLTPVGYRRAFIFTASSI